jgi:RND family efflux transporter MFP subunit
LAAPGQPLLTVEQSGVYRLEANVEESKLASVRIGERVPVKIDTLGRDLEGRVAEIVPAVDVATRAFIVRIDLAGVPGLRSGIFGRAHFANGSRGVIAVPKDAVEERGQLHLAYVVDSGKAHTRLITTGEARDGQIEALSGLNAGERIVCPIPPGLADDATVEVR